MKSINPIPWSERKKTYQKEYYKKWYQENKDHILELSKQWSQKHPEKRREAVLKWYRSHREEAIKSASKRNQSERGIICRKECSKRIKLNVLTYYGNGIAKCVLCGHDRLTSLSIDHINGGGCKHLRESRIMGGQFYRWLIKNNYPEGFRTLCMNCQFDERVRLIEEKTK